MDIIQTDEVLCTGCDRCVRECPVETANITAIDELGDTKVRIDAIKCISCGRCLSACKHHARYYLDDTERFIHNLKSGVPISVIAAPSIKTNIHDYRRLFTYLKRLGVNKIYDVSMGADICIWAHLKHIKSKNSLPLITSPCPVIVNYCELYNHKLLDRLSPIYSPMACTSIYMRNYKGITDSIAAISPCVAKADEFRFTGLTEYNVTFERLLMHLSENDVTLPKEETGFDAEEGDLGSQFPRPGGFKDSIEYFVGKDYHVYKTEGYDVFKLLDEYTAAPKAHLPDILDVLCCGDGCNLGAACSQEADVFGIDKTLYKAGSRTAEKARREYYKTLHSAYDRTFKLSDFIRAYRPIHLDIPKVTDKDIAEAFRLLNKRDSEAQSVDCGACGNDTCYGMARKIALGVNIPEHCLIKAKDDLTKEHQLSMAAFGQLAAYEKMHEADMRIKMIMGANPQINLLFDSSYTLVSGNPAAVDFFGFQSEEELLTGFNDKLEMILPESQSDGRSNSLTNRLNDALEKETYSFEMEFVFNGKVRLLEMEIRKIPYKRSFAIIAYAYDKTEAYEREHQLVQARQKAEIANKAKSKFLSIMSHEIRNPMNAIVGMSTIAKQTDDANKKEYAIDKIKDASEHLLDIINSVLDMSKIEAEKLELTNVEFSLDNVLEKVVDITAHRIEEQHQKFQITLDEEIPKTLIGDDLRLAQVIANLLSNAVKFTPAKGRIHLEAKLLSKKNDMCQLQISVEDTGIGISEEQKKNLFGDFEQADAEIVRIYGGTGLGLALSKSIIQMMGGSIDVESKSGKGSKFTFDIVLGYKPDDYSEPVEDLGSAATDSSGDSPAELPDYSGYAALLVEDSEINCEIVTTLLEPTNLTVDCAMSGEGALEKLTADPDKYDIIFMDIQMPGIDGYETTRAIRKMDNQKMPTIPIIAMTANVFREDVEQCFDAGMNGHIGKPVYVEDVVEQLGRWLQ